MAPAHHAIEQHQHSHFGRKGRFPPSSKLHGRKAIYEIEASALGWGDSWRPQLQLKSLHRPGKLKWSIEKPWKKDSFASFWEAFQRYLGEPRWFEILGLCYVIGVVRMAEGGRGLSWPVRVNYVRLYPHCHTLFLPRTWAVSPWRPAFEVCRLTAVLFLYLAVVDREMFLFS